ncbi:MAG: endonuclease/exonuclease/phosphatase family protein [Bacteroidales bacterium]|nr:endonuclease/exonuclease/phosphatase family protein [Bacteroidales bacterium]
MKPNALIITLFSLALCATACNSDNDEKIINLVTYNVGVFSKSGTNTTDMVAAMMKEINADVISMNELDSCTTRNPAYQIKDFAKAMYGWDYLYAPAIPHQGGKYGIGIAHRPELKAKRSYYINLAKAGGAEQRALAVCEFDDFVFCSTHLDHRVDEAQWSQVAQIDSLVAADFGKSDKPVILCGDLNALPDSKTISLFKKDWTIISPDDFTFPAKEPKKQIDYVMVYKNAAGRVEVKDARVCKSFVTGDVKVASDHLPVLVKIKIK